VWSELLSVKPINSNAAISDTYLARWVLGGFRVKQSIGSRTLAFPTPTWVVGTYDPDGKPNVMTAAWGGICCSRPPCVYVSLRKATYTHGNILSRRAYTISIPSENHVKEADYFGLASGRDVDKLAVSRLTPVKSSVVDAPYVEEFPVVLECRVRHIVELGLHTQFVGEILDVKADPAVLTEDGLPDIVKVKPLIFEPGNRQYYRVGSCVGQAFSIGKALQSKSL
jgi:flavin reductase (DIM6/NTAB) family NADH-FMN oxidoreductase RutF